MTDTTISRQQYYEQIREITTDTVAEVVGYVTEIYDRDEDRDTLLDAAQEYAGERLHETIDGHQWVIYYHNNLSVLANSQNDNAMIDNYGAEYAGEILQEKGLNGLHSALAYWAMEADVMDLLPDALTDALDAWIDDTDTEEATS